MTPDEKANLLSRCHDDPQLLRIVETELGVIEFHQMVAVRAVEKSKKAQADIEAVKAALSDAIELAEEGWGYVDEYYYTKWKVYERMDALKKALETPTENPV